MAFDIFTITLRVICEWQSETPEYQGF